MEELASSDEEPNNFTPSDQANQIEGGTVHQTHHSPEALNVVSPRTAKISTLEAENEALRADLQRAVAVPVLEELSRLRAEVSELHCKGHVVAESVLGGWYGPSVLLQAPYDLFLVFSIKAAEISAYFGFSYIFVEYVSVEYEMSDEEAGSLYGAYGLMCTVVGLSMGFIIDKLGVKTSMIIGCTCSTLYRTICFLSNSKSLMWFASVTFAPVAAAFGVPVLALAVRRYTHKENRSYAFSAFYTMLCFGLLNGSLIINVVRDIVGEEGMEAFGYKISWMRATVFWCAALTSYTIVAACFCRDIQVISDSPLKEREFCKFKPDKFSSLQAMKEIVHQPTFWRLCGVTMLFVGVRMLFRHLDATFPKYFLRTYGPRAPFEVILAINPIVEMVGTPIMTGMLLKYEVTTTNTFLYGAFLSGISVFALAIWESYFGAVVFILFLSLGDTIWSPKLYEYSTMAAQEGREGMYLAITMAPMYLASFPVGLISGWALERFCPRDSLPEDRDSRKMWFIIGVVSFISPILLYIFRRKLILAEDENPDGKKAEEGEGEHRKTRRLHDVRGSVDDSSPSLDGKANNGDNMNSVIGRLRMAGTGGDPEADNQPFTA